MSRSLARRRPSEDNRAVVRLAAVALELHLMVAAEASPASEVGRADCRSKHRKGKRALIGNVNVARFSWLKCFIYASDAMIGIFGDGLVPVTRFTIVCAFTRLLFKSAPAFETLNDE